MNDRCYACVTNRDPAEEQPVTHYLEVQGHIHVPVCTMHAELAPGILNDFIVEACKAVGIHPNQCQALIDYAEKEIWFVQDVNKY